MKAQVCSLCADATVNQTNMFFLNCAYTKEIWAIVLFQLNFNGIWQDDTFKDTSNYFFIDGVLTNQRPLPYIATLSIWIRSNKLVFNDK